MSQPIDQAAKSFASSSAENQAGVDEMDSASDTESAKEDAHKEPTQSRNLYDLSKYAEDETVSFLNL